MELLFIMEILECKCQIFHWFGYSADTTATIVLGNFDKKLCKEIGLQIARIKFHKLSELQTISFHSKYEKNPTTMMCFTQYKKYGPVVPQSHQQMIIIAVLLLAFQHFAFI